MLLNASIVINYYNPTNSRRLLYQTLLCVESYRENGKDINIVLVDGSGSGCNSDLKRSLQESNSYYLYFSQKKSFAEGYNAGIRYVGENWKTEYIVLSANDIVVSPQTIAKLTEEMNGGQIGCVIPYLSMSDLLCQNSRYESGTCLPTGMTLNVNMFRVDDLFAIGLVPEELSGYFNDLVMFRRLRMLGKVIKLVNAGNIYHFGKSTTGISSNASLQKDKATFWALYPDCAPINANAWLKYAMFAQTRSSRLFWSFFDHIPGKLVQRVILLGYYALLELRRTLIKCHIMPFVKG